MTITDDILQQFRTGELEQFYAVCYASLLVFAKRVLGSGCEYVAEDCVQDAIYKTYMVRARFSEPYKLKAFLFTAVHNNAVSFLRHHRRQADYLSSEEMMHDDLQANIIRQETIDAIYAAVERLPEKQREMFELSFEQGMKNAEIAAALGISESTVKQRKAKTLSLLRDDLTDAAYMAFATMLSGAMMAGME